MSSTLLIKNRQRLKPVNTRLLRGVSKTLLTEILGFTTFDLGIYLVRASEMAALNETYLQHEGSTDVITFDYADSETRNKEQGTRFLHGEIFICIDDAIAQARQFRTTWQNELVRYVIHGILHLQGFDDLQPAARRIMKQQENHLLNEMGRLFPLRKLGGASKLAP